MSNTFLRVEEVAEEMEVSKSYAYKIVQRLNRELESMGYSSASHTVSAYCCSRPLLLKW